MMQVACKAHPKRDREGYRIFEGKVQMLVSIINHFSLLCEGASAALLEQLGLFYLSSSEPDFLNQERRGQPVGPHPAIKYFKVPERKNTRVKYAKFSA